MEAQAEEPLPDLTDFMNEWFFGAVDGHCRQAYNLKREGEGNKNWPEKKAGLGGQPPPPSNSRLTQEWLEEAKRMVAGTVSRQTSPARSAVSPRFGAASQAKELTSPPSLDKREAFSRSARRNRSEGFSDEILQRSSARHNRNRSDTRFTADYSSSAAGQHTSSPFDEPDADPSPTRRLPPKRPPHPRARFLEKTHEAPPRRSFLTPSPSSRTPSPLPPENVPHQPQLLSPPRNLLESAHRRSISSSTCSIDKASTSRRSFSGFQKLLVEVEQEEDMKQINAFLRRQREMIARVSDGEVSAKAKMVLSSFTPNTSSMVAAICYAWLLENTREREKSRIKDEVVLPVINMRRERMSEHKQAAWLFHHVGIDASALIFSDELDLEGLLMGKQLSLLVVGQDVLQTNGEVGSICTILTDNYCEDAYDLLVTPNLKRLLLAGILLDTQNLNSASKSSTNKDAEAVQLLLVGSSPDYRDFFFEQVMKEHGEDSFLQSLRQHYGKLSIEAKQKPSRAPAVGRAAVQPNPPIPPFPFKATEFKATEKSFRAKHKFSLGKLFGFASK